MAREVKYKITAQDKTKPVVKGATEGLDDLGLAAKRFNTAFSLASVAVVIGGIKRIGTALVSAAREAAAFEQTSMAFRNLTENAGFAADDVLTEMKRLSSGTVSELDLMLSASRAMLFDLPVDKLDELMSIARASARVTGESVQKMFNDIVTGIGRASPLILDNLGIIVDVNSANEDYAETLGIQASQLTEAAKKQAFFNSVLEAGDEIIRKVGLDADNMTDAEKWDALLAVTKDLKAEFSSLLTVTGGIVETLTEMGGLLLENLRNARAMRRAMAGDETLSLEDEIRGVNEAIAQTESLLAGAQVRDLNVILFPKRTAARIKELEDRLIGLRDRLVELRAAQSAPPPPSGEPPAGTPTGDMGEIVVEGEKVNRILEMMRHNLAVLKFEQANQETETWAGNLFDLNTEWEELQENLLSSGNVIDSMGPRFTGVADEIENLTISASIMSAAFLDAFGLLGEALVSGEEGWANFARGAILSMAAVLDALAQQMIVIGLAKTALLSLGPGAAFIAAAAATVAAGIIRGAVNTFDHGGWINEPVVGVGQHTGQGYLIAENNPEFVSNPRRGGGPGQMVHVTINFPSRVLYDEITTATENGDIRIAARAIKG